MLFWKHKMIDPDSEGKAIGALWQQIERNGVFTFEEITNDSMTYPFLVVCYGYACKNGKSSISEKEFKSNAKNIIKNKISNELRFRIEDDMRLLCDDLIVQYRKARDELIAEKTKTNEVS